MATPAARAAVSRQDREGVGSVSRRITIKQPHGAVECYSGRRVFRLLSDSYNCSSSAHHRLPPSKSFGRLAGSVMVGRSTLRCLEAVQSPKPRAVVRPASDKRLADGLHFGELVVAAEYLKNATDWVRISTTA